MKLSGSLCLNNCVRHVNDVAARISNGRCGCGKSAAICRGAEKTTLAALAEGKAVHRLHPLPGRCFHPFPVRRNRGTHAGTACERGSMTRIS